MADQYIQQGNEAVASQSPTSQSFGFMDGSSFNASGAQITPPITPPTNRNIPVGQVGSTKAIELPQPESIDLSSGVIEAAKTGSKSITDYLKELSAPETAAGQTQSKLLESIQTLIPQTGGKAQAQLEAEQAQGIPTLKADLASINSQILSKVAEFDKISNEIEKNSNFKGSFSAKANELKRAYAAETGLLQARALGLQGQVQAAQETVNRAIDLKYSAIEEKLNIYEAQLRALEPILNKEEKDLAVARQLKIDDDKQRIAEEKAKAKENAGLAFSADIRTEFVNKNGEFFNARTGDTYKDPAAFFKAAGVSSFEEAYKRGLITDLTASRLSDIDFANQARTKYIDANIKITDSPEEVARKVQGSKIFRKENYIAPVGGGGGKGGGSSTYTTPDGKAVAISAEAEAVLNGTLRLEDLTPTVRGKIAKELTQAGYQSGPKLTAGQQEDIASMDTVSQLIGKILDYNSDGRLEGVGFATGPLGGVLTKVFGSGSQEAQDVRALVGNVKGTIAKLRGGTSFTTNEQKLLESYTPSINENAKSVISKAKLLQEFIATKKATTLSTASDRGVPAQSPNGTTTMTAPDGSKWEVPNEQINLFKQNGYK